MLQNFTPQQMAGAGKYNDKVLVGNWKEDRNVREAISAEFMQAQVDGKNVLSIAQSRRKLCEKIVRQTIRGDDECLEYGDNIQLKNPKAGIFLCNDVTSRVDGSARCPVTGHQDSRAISRNVWVIVKPPGAEKRFPGNKLLTGYPFQLACNASLRVDEEVGGVLPPYYLCSTQKSLNRSSKLRNLAEMSISTTNNSDTVFTCRKPANSKYQKRFQPVTPSENFVIIHKNTGNALDCDSNPKFAFETQFCTEWEVCGYTDTRFEKRNLLVRESCGDTTAQIPQKVELSDIFWQFVVGKKSEGSGSGELPSAVTTEMIAAYFANELTRLGSSKESLAKQLDEYAGAKGSPFLSGEETYRLLRYSGVPKGEKLKLFIDALLGSSAQTGFISTDRVINTIFPSQE